MTTLHIAWLRPRRNGTNAVADVGTPPPLQKYPPFAIARRSQSGRSFAVVYVPAAGHVVSWCADEPEAQRLAARLNTRAGRPGRLIARQGPSDDVRSVNVRHDLTRETRQVKTAEPAAPPSGLPERRIRLVVRGPGTTLWTTASRRLPLQRRRRSLTRR
jgi:hypothetical protein